MAQETILVVEDESIVAKDIEQKLHQLGYEVSAVVSSGEEALRHVSRRSPNLILMDIRLPGALDGIETAQRLWTHYRLPVVYLTAYADAATRYRARITAPFGYIIKPFTINELQTTIEMALARSRMETQLFESQQKLAATLHCLSEAVIAIDTQGCITFMNPIAEALTGWRQHEALGEPLSTVYGLIDEEQRRPLAANLVQGLCHGNVSFPVVSYALLDKTGKETPIEHSAAAIRGEKGSIIGAVIVFRDITERRRAETAIRESEARYRALVEGTLQGIVIIGQDWQCLFANAALASMLGYTQAQDLLGINMLELIAPHDRERVRGYGVAYRQQDQAPWRYECACVRRDGLLLWTEHVVTPVAWDGKTAYLTTLLDISERKQLENERLKAAKIESLGVLAGGIAHDFNNLLMVIQGYISLAKMFIQSQEKSANMLVEAEKACQRATALTQQLLTFTKGEAPVRQPASITELITESADFVLHGSNIRCVYRFPENVWPVDIDRGQMYQVLHNVVLNAKQAMPQGGNIHISAENVTLRANSSLPLPAGQYVKVVLEDQGYGIAPEHLEHIFDPYFTTKETGNGLGLASAYAIMTTHGGYIAASSTLDVGTTFSLYLPASDTAPVAVRSAAMATHFGNGKLLLMDDEGTVRALARQILTFLGYTVVEACDGNEALHLYTKAQAAGESFDAVLLDLTIPGGLGGCETLEQLRIIDPHIRAIVSSGYTDHPVLTSFRRYGFRAALTKPYTIAALSEALRNVL